MDIQYAKQLLEGLADGMNPLTGEILPAEDICNQPEIIRAFHAVLMELEKNAKPKRPLPENAGKPWTADDDQKLCQMFDNGCPAKEMRAMFKRTQGAISSRLVRLGKIQNRDELLNQKIDRSHWK